MASGSGGGPTACPLDGVVETDPETKEYVEDMMQANFEQTVSTLHDEALIESGGILPLLTTLPSGEFDEDEEAFLNNDESEDEDDDILMMTARKRAALLRRRKAAKERMEDGDGSLPTIGGGGRGRFGNRGRSRENPLTDGTFEEEDMVDQLINYRKRKADPLAKCPPPPPSKLKGGRKSLRMKTIEGEMPETATQGICSSIINRKSKKKHFKLCFWNFISFWLIVIHRRSYGKAYYNQLTLFGY
jgi:hypothetical protein